MKRYQVEMRKDYYQHLVDECGAKVGATRARSIGQRIVRLAEVIGRNNLHRCNDQWWCADERNEAKDDKIREEVEKLALLLGVKAVLNSDPRGYPVYLEMPSGYINGDWGRRGMTVPAFVDEG